MNPDKPTMPVKDAAAALGIDRERCMMAVRSGQLPGQQIGKRWVVYRLEFELILAKCRKSPQNPANPDKTG